MGGKKDSSSSGDHGAASFIPKLQAPSTGSPKQESFPYHQENNFYSDSTHYDVNATSHDYAGSYNYTDYAGQSSSYYGTHNNDNADEQAINDIDDFLKEDGF